jgi:hypothetical protein
VTEGENSCLEEEEDSVEAEGSSDEGSAISDGVEASAILTPSADGSHGYLDGGGRTQPTDFRTPVTTHHTIASTYHAHT